MSNERWIQKRYPHMKQEEAEVWTAFLKQTELEFVDLRYDLRLGEGIPPQPHDPEWMVRLKLAVTRKRVDVLARTEDDIWIFEVKPRIGLSALGQLLTYFDLFIKEYRVDLPVMLGAVGWRIAPDVRETYELHAVNIFLVEE